MGRVGNYVFNRIGYHVGSLTWVPRQSTRAGGSIRRVSNGVGSTRDLSTALKDDNKEIN